MAIKVKERFKLSIRLACEIFGLSQSSFHYQAIHSDENEEIAQTLIKLTNENKRWGFGLCFDHLRKQGKTWNHKRVYRIYRELRLNLRKKPKKQLA